jgi:large-conductance mechanosensitive channel
MEYINNTTTNIENDLNKFKSFRTNNQLIIFAAAVCIGLATKETISNVMNNILLPIITFMARTSIYYFVYDILLKKFNENSFYFKVLEKFGLFIWYLLLWFVIIIITYIFLNKFMDFNPFQLYITLLNEGEKLLYKS